MSKSLSRAQRRVIAAVAFGLGLLVAWKLSLAMTFALQGFDPDVATGSADCDQCTLTTALDGIGYLVAGLASYLLLALAIWWKLRRWGGLDSRRRGAHYLRQIRTLRLGHKAGRDDARGYLEHVRKVVPWVAASIVLVALWPTLCMSGEGGPTTCQSAVFLPLPWGDSADTSGFLAAIGAALLTNIVLRRLLRRRTNEAG